MKTSLAIPDPQRFDVELDIQREREVGQFSNVQRLVGSASVLDLETDDVTVFEWCRDYAVERDDHYGDGVFLGHVQTRAQLSPVLAASLDALFEAQCQATIRAELQRLDRCFADEEVRS